MNPHEKNQVLLVLPGVAGGWTIRIVRAPVDQFTGSATFGSTTIVLGPSSSYEEVVVGLYRTVNIINRALAQLRLLAAGAAEQGRASA